VYALRLYLGALWAEAAQALCESEMWYALLADATASGRGGAMKKPSKDNILRRMERMLKDRDTLTFDADSLAEHLFNAFEMWHDEHAEDEIDKELSDIVTFAATVLSVYGTSDSLTVEQKESLMRKLRRSFAETFVLQANQITLFELLDSSPSARLCPE